MAEFEREYGPVPDDVRWFLTACGGGTVGSEWVDGITELLDTHRKFRDECALKDGWTMRGVFVIGWDGSGNPFGIEASTGKVLAEDHTFGGIHEVAESFESFLKSGLLA